MKKYVLDLRVTSVECLGDRFLLLVTTNPDGPLLGSLLNSVLTIVRIRFCVAP